MTNALDRSREIAAKFDHIDGYVRITQIGRDRGNHGAATATLVTPGDRRHAVRLLPLPSPGGPAALGKALADVGDPRGIVVLAEHLSARARADLIARDINYIDAAGNCHLALDDGKTIVHVDGKRAARPPRTRPLRDAGYRVLFSLLASPDLLDETVRAVAVHANTSRHSVASLLANLREQGLVIRAGRSSHVLAPGGRATLIDRFAVGWADSLRGHLLIGRFRARPAATQARESELAATLERHAVPFGFGGESGAFRMHAHLPTEQTTLHVGTWSQQLQTELGLAPDRQGPVIVLRTMTDLDLLDGEAHFAHPILIYAELERSPDARTGEVSRQVLADILKADDDVTA